VSTVSSVSSVSSVIAVSSVSAVSAVSAVRQGERSAFAREQGSRDGGSANARDGEGERGGATRRVRKECSLSYGYAV
jgi:hypothetical protein